VNSIFITYLGLERRGLLLGPASYKIGKRKVEWKLR